MSSNNKIMKKTLFLEIPDELFVDLIFQFVGSQTDLLKFHYVSKRFLNLLKNSEFLYRKLCLNSWKECFVLDLPKSIMSKYYNDKFRNMFFMHNKYRFICYGVYKKIAFPNPQGVRNFDKVHGTILEKLIVRAKRDHLECGEPDSAKHTLELLYEDYASNVCVKVFYALDIDSETNKNRNDAILKGKVLTLPKENKKFPRYYDVYQWYDDQNAGYLCEETSETPIFVNCDSHLFVVGNDGKLIWKDTMIPKKIRPMYKVFSGLLDEDDELCKEFPEKYNVTPFLPRTYEDLINEYLDRLTYTKETLSEYLKRRKSGNGDDDDDDDKKVVICHMVDDTGKFPDNSIMRRLIREFGTDLVKDYEKVRADMEVWRYQQTLTWQERIKLKEETTILRRNDCAVSEFEDGKVVVCSICCISMPRKHGMRTRNVVSEFNERSFRCWTYQFEALNNPDGMIKEIHFFRPSEDSKGYDNKLVRKALNEFVNKRGFTVMFHDDRYQGSKDIYKNIGLDAEW